jgi:mono/diheme cytochrome c family protein
MRKTIHGPALGISLAALLAAAVPVLAAHVVESGDALFKTYCTSCHGQGGKGDGPLAANLRVAPADLTRLSKRAHGKFDAEQVRRIIDGRQRVASHGNSDMPVWGDAFKKASEGYSDQKVKARIDALVEYLKTIQEK